MSRELSQQMKEMQELVTRLAAAARAYYSEGGEVMSDREYDALYEQLEELERSTGVFLAGSVTQKVGYEVVSQLQKAAHAVPMLSLDKTKSVDALAEFLGAHGGLLSWKLDGITIVLRYENGVPVQALTRGNGEIGEDVTHNARHFINMPARVPYDGSFTLRGEAVISLADFEAVNAAEGGIYKNPRNLTAGTVRQLDSAATAARRVRFYAFGLVDGPQFTRKSEQLEWLTALGFECAEHELVDAESLPAAVARFRDNVHSHPLLTDGLVLTVDNIAAAAALGATSKFPRDSIAFKWADELATTTLRHIEWNTSRTGAINPVAVFDAVDIEGTSVSRASVHNLSILRQLNLRAGDQITVYKANMIIPQVAENLTAHEGYSPDWCAECPSCGGETEIQGDPEILTCPNPACPAQRLRALSHFVSRDAMNIAGLSEQTLEKLIDAGIIQSYLDIFSLAQHEEKITSMDGFGKKSFDKLIAATEAAKNVIPSNFIHALGIRHVGLANAKLLCAHFNFDLCRIATGCLAENYLEQLLEIHGFGEAIAGSLHAFFASEANHAAFAKACEIMNFQIPAISAGGALDGRVFVVTGDVHKFDNRKALANFIEANGGRVSGSVSAKTSYLINNDTASTSGKNKKARQLGIPVISEDELLGLLESA